MEIELNWKEQRVLEHLLSNEAEAVHIREIARVGFSGVRPQAKADSQVRNSLRKLVKLELVRPMDAGTYSSYENLAGALAEHALPGPDVSTNRDLLEP